LNEHQKTMKFCQQFTATFLSPTREKQYCYLKSTILSNNVY